MIKTFLLLILLKISFLGISLHYNNNGLIIIFHVKNQLKENDLRKNWKTLRRI